MSFFFSFIVRLPIFNQMEMLKWLMKMIGQSVFELRITGLSNDHSAKVSGPIFNTWTKLFKFIYEFNEKFILLDTNNLSKYFPIYDNFFTIIKVSGRQNFPLFCLVTKYIKR